MLKPPLTLRPRAATPGGAEATGPVAWWKLDESSGPNASSGAGTNLTGQIHGQPRWAPDQGRQRGALELDGASNWIECTDSTDLSLGETLSVGVWFKARADAKGSDTLVAKGSAWQLIHATSSNGEVEFALSGPQTTGAAKNQPPRAACPAPPADGQWHHVAGVYDGSRITLFVDGQERASTTASGPVEWNNHPVTLGDNAASRGRRWNGWLDDARLYARALKPDEVKALYAGDAK